MRRRSKGLLSTQTGQSKDVRPDRCMDAYPALSAWPGLSKHGRYAKLCQTTYLEVEGA